MADARSSAAELAAPQRDDDEVAGEALGLAVSLDQDRGDGCAGLVRLQPTGACVRQERHVGVLERRADAEHLGVRLAVHRTREAVAVLAPHARAVRHVRLDQSNAARRMERVIAGAGQVVGELLDPRLVRDGRERIRRARMRFGRILAAGAVHLVQLLGPRVVRLEHVVGDRPGGRDAVVMVELAEVLFPQAVERCAVELRRPADEVVHLRLECLAGVVVPGVGGHVLVVDEDVLGEPVRRLARKPVAALEQQDGLAGVGERPGERSAARSGADDDHVVVAHRLPFREPGCVPGSVAADEVFRLLRPPGSRRVGMHRRGSVEQRLEDPPGLLDARPGA